MCRDPSPFRCSHSGERYTYTREYFLAVLIQLQRSGWGRADLETLPKDRALGGHLNKAGVGCSPPGPDEDGEAQTISSRSPLRRVGSVGYRELHLGTGPGPAATGSLRTKPTGPDSGAGGSRPRAVGAARLQPPRGRRAEPWDSGLRFPIRTAAAGRLAPGWVRVTLPAAACSLRTPGRGGAGRGRAGRGQLAVAQAPASARRVPALPRSLPAAAGPSSGAGWGRPFICALPARPRPAAARSAPPAQVPGWGAWEERGARGAAGSPGPELEARVREGHRGGGRGGRTALREPGSSGRPGKPAGAAILPGRGASRGPGGGGGRKGCCSHAGGIWGDGAGRGASRRGWVLCGLSAGGAEGSGCLGA